MRAEILIVVILLFDSLQRRNLNTTSILLLHQFSHMPKIDVVSRFHCMIFFLTFLCHIEPAYQEIRDGNKENNLADKVADKLFFYQTNEKNTGQAFSWSSTASCFIFEQPFTKALSFSLPRFVWMFWPQQISQYIKPLLLSYFNQGLPTFHSSLNPLPLVFFLGFLGGGSAGPVLADCSDSSACDCDAWDCLLLTFSISASSFSPSSFFFWLPFFHHHSFFSKIVWYPFCLEKITARGFVFILCK